jgi:HSP20 family protein
MNLIRYNTPMSNRWSGLDHWFGHPLSRSFGNFDRLFDLADGLRSRTPVPGEGGIAADLYEDEDHYYARVEMPGVKKDQVELSLDDSLLSIGFHRKSKDGEAHQENVAASRSLTVPDGIDADKVSAKLEDGVLTVTLPKAEERKPRSIKVK